MISLIYRELAALLLVLSTSVACAAIGTVTEVSGPSGEIARGRLKFEGRQGESVESNDIVTTVGGTTYLTFVDNTKVKITANSRLLIDSFVYDPKSGDAGRLALKVGLGTVRYASGQIAKNDPTRVAIATPSATIAVRGTDFVMSVDESGQSLVVLVPSCGDSAPKEYELAENNCAVGKIEVETLAGRVVLDRAFEATFVVSNSIAPTPPIVLNTVESNLNNNLLLIKPLEIRNVLRNDNKNSAEDELRNSGGGRSNKGNADDTADESVIIDRTISTINRGCDSARRICVTWERPTADSISDRGRAVAHKFVPNEHTAEVKTGGYASNTTVTIIQDDSISRLLLGDGSPGGNTVTIKQSAGVRR